MEGGADVFLADGGGLGRGRRDGARDMGGAGGAATRLGSALAGVAGAVGGGGVWGVGGG